MDQRLADRLLYIAKRLHALGGHLAKIEPRCQAVMPQVRALIGGAAGEEDKKMEDALRIAGQKTADAANQTARAGDKVEALARRMR